MPERWKLMACCLRMLGRPLMAYTYLGFIIIYQVGEAVTAISKNFNGSREVFTMAFQLYDWIRNSQTLFTNNMYCFIDLNLPQGKE